MTSSSLFSRPPGLGRGWKELDEGSTISIASEAGRRGWVGAGGPWWHVEHMAEFCCFFLHFSQRRPRPTMSRTVIAPLPKEKPWRIEMLKPYWFEFSELMLG